jgi:hypothetical protein
MNHFMNRRSAIKLGTGLVAAAGAGFYGGYQLLPPSPSKSLLAVDELARRFYLSLNAQQHAETCVAYDHPLRQYHNRGVSGGGRDVLTAFTREQKRILTDLMYAGLSERGRERVPQEDLTRYAGVNGMRVLICGDPTSPPYQIVLTGVHLNLRLGGKSREGAAFGGPQVYGDQSGNGRVGLPNNVYREQFLVAQKLLRNLDSGRRKLAVLEEAPVQTQIELQGRRGSFAGIPVSELAEGDKVIVRELINTILTTYAPSDVAYAHECLEVNGGTDGFSLSYYQHGEDGDIPEAQVFRLEGPAAVLYFRGYPHVHAFINVAMDGDSPLSVGEPLGTNPTWLKGKAVKNLFEIALRGQTDADLSYYEESSVAGRLRPGIVRSGDIYNLESWQESATIVGVRGSNLSAELTQKLRDASITLQLDKLYSVATTAYVADEPEKRIGRIESRRPLPMLRDLTIDYLKSHGFPTIQA